MDSTQLQILPLSLIMVMGPQILTAIFLVTSDEPVKNSGAMLVGVVLAASLSLAIWFGLYEALGIKPRSGSGPSTADYVVAGLLALAGIHAFIGRRDASVPKWMSALQQAKPTRASGDTVLYDGVKGVAERLSVDTAIVHLGGVQFPVSGPLRYTMTARDVVRLSGLLRPRRIIPIHYEGWKHFREGRDAIERELAGAPEEIRQSVR